MRRWKDPVVWLRGLLAAFIGGGAGAVASGFIAVANTPAEYNFKSGLNNLLIMIGGTFLVSGMVSAAAYLQRSPLPEVEEWDGAPVGQKQLTRSDIGLDQPKDKT